MNKLNRYLVSILMFLTLSLFTSCSNGDDKEPNPNVKPTPMLTSISPTNGPKTTIVTINGNDFGTDLGLVTVFFNDVEAQV